MSEADTLSTRRSIYDLVDDRENGKPHLDRNRLTGGGISSGLDEALKLIELLTDRATAESVQQTTQYYPDPPVSSEIPNTITSPMPTPRRHRHPARSSTSTR